MGVVEKFGVMMANREANAKLAAAVKAIESDGKKGAGTKNSGRGLLAKVLPRRKSRTKAEHHDTHPSQPARLQAGDRTWAYAE